MASSLDKPAHVFVGWVKPVALLPAATLLAACATSDFAPERVLKPAENGPDRFVVAAGSGAEASLPARGEGCRSPMADPRDGTRLTLIRSDRDRGDYAVPDGHYGVGRGELLRLDCATGEIIGVVSR